MSKLTTLQKAQRLLGYEDLEPRKLAVQPHLKSGQKKKRDLSFSSVSKSQSNAKMRRDFSFCKTKNKLESSMNMSSSCLKERKVSNRSFVSAYGKETRYDKIMKLKVKPVYNRTRREDRNKNSVLSSSVSSCGSPSAKENMSRNKLNRLDKIMKIKVAKPKVNSTLTYYEPKQGVKSSIVQKRESAVKEWKECQAKLKKAKDQEDKEDRLWKVFQRERDLRMRLKKQAEERMYKEQRRKEQRFESLISKQVGKIEKDRELSKRRKEGFSNYLYPQ